MSGAKSQTTASEMAKVERLIFAGEKCPKCPRQMAQWFGCESPNCPVPLEIQSRGVSILLGFIVCHGSIGKWMKHQKSSTRGQSGNVMSCEP